MKENFLTKRVFMSFLTVLSMFSGCAGMFSMGKPVNVNKYYSDYIGIKVIPTIYPAVIVNNGDIVFVHMPHNQPYGKLIANVPEETVITIDHVLRKYSVEGDVFDHLMGRIDVPGYSGFVTVGICNGKEKRQIKQCIDMSKYQILNSESFI